jgi:molybdopterin-guanine dinucleotide biosynthesis protein A
MQSMANITSITGIVLAGGKSTRIGANKPQLKIGKSHLIDRVLDMLSQVTPSILIVTTEDQPDLVKSITPGVRVVKDIHPGKGPLGGIYTGLSYSEDVYNLVVGCDMPFLNGGLIRYLIDGASGYDALAPKIGWMIQPLHTIYSKSCLPSIEALIREEQLQIIKLFNLVNTRYVTEKEIDQFDPDHLSFLNINTEDDLMKAEVLVQQQRQKELKQGTLNR